MAGEFELALGRFAEKFLDLADEAVIGIVLEVHGKLVERSPVDTGWFRAQWTYGLDDFDTAPRPSPPLPEGRQPGDGPIYGGPKQPPFTVGIGHIHFLYNNAPYARRLEYGYSGKAPNGMVRITVAEFHDIVERQGQRVAQ